MYIDTPICASYKNTKNEIVFRDPYAYILSDPYSQRKEVIQSTYRDFVAVGPVADISIRKRGIICDLGPGFDIFIGSVTHGPTSIVWRHITVGPECIWKASSIRVQLIHTISPRITSHLNVFAVFPRSLEREKNQDITHSRRNRYRNKCSTEQDIVGW